MSEANRRIEFRSLADSNGFDYVPEFDRNGLGVTKPFSLFDGWVSGANLVRGRFGPIPFQLFDMSRTVTSRDTDGGTTTSTMNKTAVVVENRTKLPELRLLASRGIAAGLFNLAGRVGLEFGPDGGFPEDAQVVREFNHSWFIESDQLEAGMEFRETPDGISLKLVKDLVSGRGWSVEVSGDHILIHLDQKLAPAGELQNVLSEVQTLVELLQSRESPRLCVRRLPPVGVSTLFGSLVWPFGGAVLGMITTMVVFGTVFAVLGEMPTAAILAFPFVGMALMAGGALLMVTLRNRRQRSA